MKQFLVSLFVSASIVAGGYAFGAECVPARDSHGRIKRSSYQLTKFKKLHPCPATGLSTGRCPGYVIDHIKPLACCGADKPENMQWQTIAEAKAKDAWERKQCGGTV